MIKRIEVLGIELDNYTVREAIRQVEVFLEDQMLNTIECVTMQMLMDARTDSVLKETLSALSLTVVGEKQILQAMGIHDAQRLREVKDNDFLSEFFKRLERNKKRIFLLGQTSQQLTECREIITRKFPKLLFAGEYAVEHCGGDAETVINDLNVTTPDVVLSVLPSPYQEHFLAEHKDKINANVWCGLGAKEIGNAKTGVRAFFHGKMQISRFKNTINQYEEMR